jgi:hypothetical protein
MDNAQPVVHCAFLLKLFCLERVVDGEKDEDGKGDGDGIGDRDN